MSLKPHIAFCKSNSWYIHVGELKPKHPKEVLHEYVMTWKRSPHCWPFVRDLITATVNPVFSGFFFQVMPFNDAFVVKHVAGKSRLYLAHSQPFVSVIFMAVNDTNITLDVVLLCNAVNDVGILWQVYYSNPFHGLISWAIPFKLKSRRMTQNPRWWYDNMGSGNGLMPAGSKPLPVPILTYIPVTICRHWVTMS